MSNYLRDTHRRRFGAVSGFVVVLIMAAVGGAFFAKVAEKNPGARNVSSPQAIPSSSARHDASDMLFRRVPMNVAARSVVISLSSNLHLAFDTELLRTHTVWQGEGLNLWGAVYHGGKDKFYCDFDGQVLWTMPPVFPWAVGVRPKAPGTEVPAGARFLGLETKGREVSVVYELPVGRGKPVRVRETPRVAALDATAILRRLEIGPCSEDLYYLANAESGGGISVGRNWTSLKRRDDVVAVSMEPANKGTMEGAMMPMEFEQGIWKEVKNDSELQKTRGQNSFATAWLKIPAHAEDITIKLATGVYGSEALVARAVSPFAGEWRTTRPQPPSKPEIFKGEKAGLASGGDDYFRIEHFPLPKEIELQVTGMDFLPNGDLAVCTWLGEVYIVQQPQGEVPAATYRRFARGLCEPGGLKVINGQIYVVQKPELTRLVDTDGNGECDRYECINQGWGFTGNYHDFSFGPVVDAQGNFHVYRTGNHGIYEFPYMGWDVQISADGKSLAGFCSGLRSPNGFGTYGTDYDLFMTDNQGNWIGACTLNHLQRGKFYGYPATAPAPKEDFTGQRDGRFAPPAVWFPYTLAKSASGFTTISDNRFGLAFKGQMLVGDFQNAIVMRVALEKVNGEWQGAVWPFVKGFGSGVNRLAMGPDGKLYVGGCKNKAWAAVAPRDYSLDRVSCTGQVPFEVSECHARPDGLELTFTSPTDSAAAGNPESYDVAQFKYKYHAKYGSPEIDHEGRENRSTSIKIGAVKVSADGLKARLKLEGWKPGYVTLVRGLDVRSADGRKLWHDTFHYTLNQIPRQ